MINLRFILLAILAVYFSTTTLRAQSCDDDNLLTAIFDILATLGSNDDSSNERTKEPVIRTENIFFRGGFASTMSLNEHSSEFSAFGLSATMMGSLKKNRDIYIGAELQYGFMGSQKDLDIQGWYESIDTNHSLRQTYLVGRYVLSKTDDFKTYAGVNLGLISYNTTTKGFYYVEDDCGCETLQRDRLRRHHSTSMSYGAHFGVEIPLGDPYNHFFIEMGYQRTGLNTMVDQESVEIDGHTVNYQIRSIQSDLVNFKIGMTFYF